LLVARISLLADVDRHSEAFAEAAAELAPS
jgi:hypothetical protein